MNTVQVHYVIGGTVTTDTIKGTRVTANLANSGRCVVKIYDATGREIETYLYFRAVKITWKYDGGS